VCAYYCARLSYTAQHRTVLINFPLILQTITVAEMMSTGGEGQRPTYENHPAMLRRFCDFGVVILFVFISYAVNRPWRSWLMLATDGDGAIVASCKHAIRRRLVTRWFSETRSTVVMSQWPHAEVTQFNRSRHASRLTPQRTCGSPVGKRRHARQIG